MSTLRRPRPFVEEVPSTSKPIEAVGTSIAAFVGLAPGGPVNRPIRISSWTQFSKIYSDPQHRKDGPFMQDAYLAHAVHGFFENGGRICWVARAGQHGKAGRADSERAAALRDGIGSLAAIDEITMISVPDVMALAGRSDARSRDLQRMVVEHCETNGGRMVLLDPPPDLPPQEMAAWRKNVAGYDSASAALYYPWIEVMDRLSKRPRTVPPSGHVAGVWARTSSTSGIHRTPTDAAVLGASGVAVDVSEDEQRALTNAGVNSIRSFPGRGIRVWGSRTLSSDPEWRYVTVRRLFLHICESIKEGTQWAVFEPNDEELWTQLRIAVSNFLTRAWLEGALFGSSPEQAFYVKCDEETNPPDMVEAGQVVIEIGIVPTRPASAVEAEPAEFVVFRISHPTAAAADVAASPKRRASMPETTKAPV